GVVKVTPAHDFNDYAVGQRHSLPLINIFTPDAATNDVVPEHYRGMDRYEARKVVLADLDAAGLLVETKPHKLQVPRGDRTGQVIEPYLTDQWFVKMDAIGAHGLELVESGAVKFVPGNWINTYRHWMENIQDWCISRQLWWGHRIPAWYDAQGRIYVGCDEADVRATHALGDDVALSQDNDVLETWFSSALWPFSTMGWPNEKLMAERGFDRYVPSSVLVTGFDIIFFWVARMIMMTDRLVGEIPFHDVYITGLVRDSHGQKMSKSKGNILDPLDLIDGITLDDLVAKRTSGLMQPKMAEKIEKATRREFPDGIPAFGADALRFTMAALAGHGRDIKFDLGRAEGYKNFCNKLWNATRFVLMNTEGFIATAPLQPQTPAEHWILRKLETLCEEIPRYFERGIENNEELYRFDLAANALYEFTWHWYCDSFLEAAKQALNGNDPAASKSTQHTLLYVLDNILRLLHPLIPFVTEELWRQVAPRLGNIGPTISTQDYPKPTGRGDRNSASDFDWALGAAHQIRALRSQMGIPPLKLVPLVIEGEPDDPYQIVRHQETLKFLAKLSSITVLNQGEESPPSMLIPLGQLKFHIPLEGLVDLGAERTRLDKELKRVDGELAKSRSKLASETFVANAPASVVEQERQRLLDWTAQQRALSEQRAKL
ncbi:MAG: valine--tRNA ligase, partial [Xanthomonadaceae bacterium]|nr:valine--tRNA ligase [Xanthomonadaceae bacterium]